MLNNYKKTDKMKNTKDIGIDLFEDYTNIPAKVQTILDKYENAFVDGDYKQLEKAHKALNKIGYTFEYYLDGQAYDLRPIGTKGKSEMDEFRKGGSLDKENSDMVLNNNKQISHHTKELANAVNKNKNIPAWVVAKVNRSATDISDATHYLEGAKYKKGGNLGFVKDSQGNYKNTAGYELIDQFDGTYQVLDADGMDIVGEYVTLKDGKQAIKDYMEEINELAKGGNLGFCYSIGGL